MVLPKPYFKVIYRGIDISSDLDPQTTSITYTDHHHGEADEIEITVHDKDGRWQGSWKPEKGDQVSLIIYDGHGGILPCGDFELDEPEASGDRSGDRTTMRGLAAPISKELRTENSKGFEKQTLKAIVSEVASKNGLSLEGEIEDLFFERVSQRRERDLEFLTRLAEETGHYFTVKGNQAIFTTFRSVDGRDPALKINRFVTDLIDYTCRQQNDDTYSGAKVSYLDQNTKKNTVHEARDDRVSNGDVLKIAGERVESQGHAEARAKSALHYKNRKANSGSITLVGNVRMLAGNTIEMVGFGQYSGKRLLKTTTHSMERGGYTSSGDYVDVEKS